MTFFHFGRGVIWNYEEGHITAFAITLAVLFMSVFISRFWCRYLCPLGAATAILRKFNITGIKRSSKCIDCKICDRECPVGIHVSKAKDIHDEECLNCNKCIDHCPVDALNVHTMKKRIGSGFYGLMVVGLFLLVIGASMAFGLWQSVPVIKEGSPLGPDDIKGSMAIQAVLDSVGLTKEQFAKEFALPQDTDTSIKLNEIAEKYGVDFHTEYLREYLRLKNNPLPKSTCPFGLIADPYPGRCGLYVDSDENRICDYSE
jgi:NAD-dependent dihydropyrimidine dehydrogenase PreA subunit